MSRNGTESFHERYDGEIKGESTKRQQAIQVSVLIAALGLSVAIPAFGDDRETEAVRAAADQFYAALNTMITGDLGPMKEIWSHQNDVTYMGPAGGFRVGWDAVLTDWAGQAAMRLGGNVEPKGMRITVGRDLAIVSNFEIGKNLPEDGLPEDVTIRATNLFRKEDDRTSHRPASLPRTMTASPGGSVSMQAGAASQAEIRPTRPRLVRAGVTGVTVEVTFGQDNFRCVEPQSLSFLVTE